jgi:hypothetical protein
VTKIVYNACFGGLSLSDAAVKRYAEIKGFALYPEKGPLTTYWLIPPEERVNIPDGAEWHTLSLEERQAYNERYSKEVFQPRDLPRHDPVFVQVVEELGPAANGRHAELRIAEVPSGSLYRIDEYGGSESVMTPSDYQWETAP